MAASALFVGGPYDGRAYAPDELKAVGEVQCVGGKQFALMPPPAGGSGDRSVYLLRRDGERVTFHLSSAGAYAEALGSGGQSFDVAEAHAEEWLASEANRLAALVATSELKPTTDAFLLCRFRDAAGGLGSLRLPLDAEVRGQGVSGELLVAYRRDALLLNLRSVVMGLAPSRLAPLGVAGPLASLELLLVERAWQ